MYGGPDRVCVRARVLLRATALLVGPPGFASRCARGRVGGDIQHIFRSQFRNDRLHEIRPYSLTRALLHIVKLTHKVAGRTARDSRNRAEPFQVGAMAYAALSRLAAAAVGDKRLTFLDAARRHIRNKARMRITQKLGVLRFFGRLDDTLTNGLFTGLGALQYQEHASRDARLRHRVGLDDPDPRRPLYR